MQGNEKQQKRKMGNRVCVFCKIIDGTAEAKIHFRDDELIVFDDRFPDADNHLLVCSTECIRNINALKPQHLPLLRRMQEAGIAQLERLKLSPEDALLGFHVPPVNSVHHLHLHVLAPRSSLKGMKKFIFDSRFLHFKTAETVISDLEKRAERETAARDS